MTHVETGITFTKVVKHDGHVLVRASTTDAIQEFIQKFDKYEYPRLIK